MKRRTFVLGMGTAAAGGSVLLGSGAFSGVESDRTVTVETVGDENAYLRLVYQDTSFTCEETVTLFTITNHFTEPIVDVDVDVSVADGITLDNIDTPEASGGDDVVLDVGESFTVTADAVCEEDSTSATVTFDVTASGTSSSVDAPNRSIELSCTCQN